VRNHKERAPKVSSFRAIAATHRHGTFGSHWMFLGPTFRKQIGTLIGGLGTNISNFIIPRLFIPNGTILVGQVLPLFRDNIQNIIIFLQERRMGWMDDSSCHAGLVELVLDLLTSTIPRLSIISFFFASVKHIKADRGGLGGAGLFLEACPWCSFGVTTTPAALGGILRCWT
jgi:hypothetical protein